MTSHSAEDEAKVRVRAKQLCDSGIPYHLALAIARGKAELSEVLLRLFRNDRVNQLVAKHGLSRALATQVVLGQADLTTVLHHQRLHQYRKHHKHDSCLTKPFASNQWTCLAVYGQTLALHRITQLSRYELTLVPKHTPEAPETIAKLLLQYACLPNHQSRVMQARTTHPSMANHPVVPIVKPQERYAIADKTLFTLLEANKRLQLTTLEGYQFTGTLCWFARYEIGLTVAPNTQVTVFRHAIRRMTVPRSRSR